MPKIGLGDKRKWFVDFLVCSSIRRFDSSPDLVLQHLMVEYPAPYHKVSDDFSQVCDIGKVLHIEDGELAALCESWFL